MPVQPKQLSGLFLALTPVTYRLTGTPAVELFGYLDEQVSPLALYSDMDRQNEVIIGSNPTDAISSSIKPLVSDPAAIAQGINASTDIEALKTGVETLATNSIAPVGGRLPVSIADLPGTPITGESIDAGGAGLFGWLSMVTSFLRAITGRLPALVGGRIPVSLAGTTLSPVRYVLNGFPSAQLIGYLDTQAAPVVLYSDLRRQFEVTIGTGPSDAIAASIRAWIPESTDVATGIDASTDINAIVADLDTIAANSIAPISGRLPVSVTDMPGSAITGESIGVGGAGLFGWLSASAGYLRQLLASAGAPGDTAATSDTGSFSLVALVKRSLVRQANMHAVQCTGSRSGGTADNAAVTGTIAAPGAGFYLWIRGYSFSYSATPSTARTLTIASGGVDLVNLDVTTSGAGPVVMGVAAPANTAVTFSLAASGAAGNVGKLTIYHTVLAVI